LNLRSFRVHCFRSFTRTFPASLFPTTDSGKRACKGSGKANSHEKIGWQKFTDKVISLISLNTTGVVFLLWGGFARKKESLVDLKKHAVIKTAHPSPLSATKWFGCKCFSKANAELTRMGRPTIDWKSL
ncbi:uracil-DNA glycosylase family protein, partial [Cooperia oncophora]